MSVVRPRLRGPNNSGAARPQIVLLPCTLQEANSFVHLYHRHHTPVIGHKFSLSAVVDQQVVGVAIVGRPVARHRDDGVTLEVTRLCTDGTRNACSFLYAACARASLALGYKRIGTYILATEPGTSLKASGWRVVHSVKGASWSHKSRPRVDKHPLGDKILYETGALDVEDSVQLIRRITRLYNKSYKGGGAFFEKYIEDVA